MAGNLPSFRDYDDPSRKEPYGWDYGHGAGRTRVTFEKAKQKTDYKKDYAHRWFSDRHAVLTFNVEEHQEIQLLKRKLGEASIADAVEFFLKHRAGQVGAVPLLADVLKDRVADLERRGSASVSHAQLYGDKFIAFAGNKPVDLYDRATIQSWIDDLVKAGAKRNTVKGNLNQVKKLFSDALTDGHIERSPATRIQLPTTRGEKRLTLIDPVDLLELLELAWATNRQMAGLLAILFFTGMRISMIAVPPRKLKDKEFMRLDMIDRENRTIVVPAGIMKSEADLIIDDAPECLWGWLTDLKKADFGIAQNTFNLRKQKLIDTINEKRKKKDDHFVWHPNLHRRSFGSNLAALKGRSYAADMMGDSTESVFVKHYKVPAFKAEAAKYVEVERKP